MTKSLFAQYVHEREGKHVIESADGFAVIQWFDNTQEVYIEDIYVVPEKRKSGVGLQMLKQVEDMARAKGYFKVCGSVRPSARGSTDSLKILLSVGFKLHSSVQDGIWFVKEIK